MLVVTPERANPFPGLRSFEPDEEHLFFGREEQIDQLLGRLRQTRFLSVVGASGSGKSSLVRSGLIPSLHSGFMAKAGSSWRIALLRPGGNPVRNLAIAFESSDVIGGDPSLGEMGRALVESSLRRSARGLVDLVREARLPAGTNVLVIVDQFEELFRFKRAQTNPNARDEAVAFVKLLLAAAAQDEVPVYVVLTMRSEFIGHCTEFPGLAEAVNAGQYLIPRLTRDELRLAITGPVAVSGSEISPRLVTRLLNEVGDDPDQLPILQHALMRTWAHWATRQAAAWSSRSATVAGGPPIDLDNYDSIGTMENALSLHAEEAYAELTGERERQITERIFSALTDMTPEAAGIRRPSRVQELCEIAGASRAEVVSVIERFRAPGRSFLLPSSDVPLDDQTIVDLSHESLMRVWTRLSAWTYAEARSAEIYKRVSQGAALSERGETGLWRDPELQLALNWREANQPTAAWARRYDAGFDRAMDFLAASQRARDAELAEKESRRRRELVRTRAYNIAVTIALIVALALGGFAVSERNAARRSSDLARAEEAKARDAMSASVVEADNARRERARAEEQRDLAQKANAAARTAEQIAREQAAIAALKESEATTSAEQARVNADLAELNAQQARANADTATRMADEALKRQQEAQAARAAAELAREQEKSAHDEANRLGRLTLARALAARALSEWEPSELEIPALLARQAYVLTQQNGGDAEAPDLYNALSTSLSRLKANQTQMFLGHDDAVRVMALDASGAALATGGDDGQVQLFDAGQSARVRASLRMPETAIRSLAFSPQKTLAIGALDGSIRLWDTTRPNVRPKPIVAHTSAVSGLAYDARGRLASAGFDGAVKLWSLESAGQPLVLLKPGAERILGLAISRDGNMLAAGSDGGGVLMWDLRTPSDVPQRFGGVPRASAVAFSDDGQLVAAGTTEGRIVYWNMRDARDAIRGPAAQHASSVTGLTFGKTVLASSSLDGTIKLWRLASGTPDLDQQPVTLTDHNAWVWAVALTHDSARVFSAGADRAVRSALTQASPLADAVCKRVSRNLTAEQWNKYISSDIPYAATCPGLPVTAGTSR
jgi:hypothetical protein